jgi:PAS domain S-box-containing protein
MFSDTNAEVLARRAQAAKVLDSLTDALPALVAYLDRDFIYRSVNQRYVEWFDRPVSEIVGRSILDLIGPDAFAHIRPYMQRALAGEQVNYELWVPLPGGAKFIQATYVPDRDESGQVHGLFALVLDMTQRQMVDESLRKQNERLRWLWEAAAVLLSTAEPDAMIRHLFMKLAPHFQLDVYLNYMLSPSGDGLVLHSSLGLAPAEEAAIARLQLGQALCGTSALLGRPIVATYIQDSDDPKAAFAKQLGLRSFLCNPLIADGRVIGTLSFASRRRNAFEPTEVEFFETLSRYVAVAYERNARIAEMREADRRKDDFLATLAHELRSPLAPICNAIELLQMGSGDPEIDKQCRDTIQRQAWQLVRLVDDLLDVSRITRDKLELRAEPVDLADALKNAVEASRPLIEARQHVLHITQPTEAVPVLADKARLAQVFLNLLNNAAKYCEPGGQIRLAVERDGQDVLIRISDSGVGIDPHKLAQIFELFTQVDQSLTRAQGGLGIGLTLSKRLVEMHGGLIRATSEGLGKGSEFTVRLPTIKADSLSRPKMVDHAQTTLQSWRVLVVDDTRAALHMMSALLRKLGQQVETAPDGKQALLLATAGRHDIVFSDIGMPGMDGYALARTLRQELPPPHPVLVALTGYGQESDRNLAIEAGFDVHLVKPVSMERLSALLAEMQQAAASAK